MSYDEADAWEEAGMEAMYEQVTGDPAVKQQFYEQLYDEIVKDFTDNRLRSFYEEQPDVAAPAIDALEEAKKFLPHHDTAAFIFAYIAAEVGLTSALLKPVVHGLVHSETAAALIAKLAIKHSDENFTKILLDLLAAHGHVDPRTYKRGDRLRRYGRSSKTCGRSETVCFIRQSERLTRMRSWPSTSQQPSWATCSQLSWPILDCTFTAPGYAALIMAARSQRRDQLDPTSRPHTP